MEENKLHEGLYPHDLGPGHMKGRHALIKWNEQWYKIPFFLLEELPGYWFTTLQKNRYHKTKDSHGDPDALREWLIRWSGSWTCQAITELKEILEVEMPAMEAFKLYDTA